MSKQNQHRVSQVYLKQFGYLTPSGQWKISTLDLNKSALMDKIDKLIITQQSIESVIAEYNIFDLAGEPPDRTTLFEDLNGQIETWYPSIISDIKSDLKLSEKSEGILVQFISNLLCRVEPFRELIFNHINSVNRLPFLKAMCAFQADKGIGFMKRIENLSIESQLNPVCFMVMEHILNKLCNFDYVLLSDYDNRGWLTSDNPVVLENNISHNSIFSIDTELYFPLTKDYCVFFSHQKSSNKDNPLRQYKSRTCIDSTKEIQEMIFEKIRQNAYRLIFFPLELKSAKLYIE